MWNFGNFGSFGSWWNLGQMVDQWKNWNVFGNFGNWGGVGQQPTTPVPVPAPVKPPADQMETLNRIIDLAKQLMPNYDYLTMQLSIALNSQKADCIAYSLFIKIACDAVGIPCDLIFGTQDVNAFANGYHVWNRVKIAGQYFWSDATYVFWGDEGCRAFQAPREGQAGMAAYYLIGVDGSVCQLETLDLNLPPKADQQYCTAANMIVALTEKMEYSKCYDRVVSELKAARLL